MTLRVPPSTAGQMRERIDEISDFVKKLGNPNRLLILCALVDGERSVGQIEKEIGIRQPVLSQQLAELREAGFIVGTRSAKQVYYNLVDDRVVEFIAVMNRLFCGSDQNLRLTAYSKPRLNAASQAAVFARTRRTQDLKK